MLVLFMYLLWSISYTINLIVFKIFFLKKFIKKNSKIMKLLLLVFFNKNLSFYKDNLSNEEINRIYLNRFNKYPIIFTIHNKINFIFLNKNKNNLNFKNNFKVYNYLENNNLTLNLISETTLNSIINYSIIKNVIKSSLNTNELNLELIVYFNLYKNSISNKLITVEISYLKKLNSSLNLKFKNNLINLNPVNNLVNKKLINLVKYINFLNNIKNSALVINQNFLSNISKLFSINFSASTIVKYLSDISVSKSTILFLRKNKIFNKSRYSRNRQTYRTGAYWCLYINIIAVIAFYFWFYNFTMNFGYVWWLLYSFILSFFLFKAVKFNFYNIKTLLNELKLSFIWLYSIFLQILKNLSYLIKLLVTNQKANFLINRFFKLDSKLNICKNSLIYLNKLNDIIYSKIN